MNTNSANKYNQLLFPELSYLLTGLLFKVHNSVGQFGREKQYGDMLENLLKESKVSFTREKPLPIKGINNNFTNIVDFDINGELLLDLKSKPRIGREDYSQMKRYLDASGYKLGIIVNFSQKYLKPIRIIRSGI